MKKVLSIVFLLSACGQMDSASTTQQFYSASKRRPPKAAELGFIGHLNGCTAFFVENKNQKPLVMTARHCVQYSIGNWCSGGGQITDMYGNTGTCKKVVAASSGYDLALVEMNIAPDSRRTYLKLASYTPPVNARLQMLGFPADNYPYDNMGRGKFTVSENCWVMSGTVGSPHQEIREASVRHNCSTYGGNSGGPMILENSRTAVGMPFTYEPNNYQPYNSNTLSTSAYMAQMADFVSRHRTSLQAAGVTVTSR